MTSPDDRVAREAARQYVTRAAHTLDDAIRLACDLLKAPPPSRGRVRRHIQAMEMQALGDAGYRRRHRAVLETAEALMTLLDETFDDVEPHLVGRAARGRLDGDVTLHIRLYTGRPVRDLARVLVDHGYDELAFETAHTKRGRLDRLRLDADGVEAVLTRCPPGVIGDPSLDLFSGRPIEALDLRGLRRRLAELAMRDRT